MYRIRRTEQGFVVEYRHAKWTLFGIKWIWKPFLKYRGTDDVYCFTHTTIAKEQLVKKILEYVDNELKNTYGK